MSNMRMPGFTADSVVFAAGRRYPATLGARTGDRRASAFMARTKVSGPGGTQCELDATLTVEENGGTSTTNIWKCTTPVEIGNAGSGTSGQVWEEGEGGGGRGGGSQPTPKPTPPRPRPRWPDDLGNGPNRNQLPDFFECRGGWVPADLEVCHACSDTSSGVRCTCYDCQKTTGLCTRGYDCTDLYG